MEGTGSNPEVYLDNAIRAVREKKQVPEIDFTIHEMEDGSQVNTQERVCKGESTPFLQRCGVLNRAYHHQTDC
jgi:serine/threonine-protein phosphatase 2B catalytic subunit